MRKPSMGFRLGSVCVLAGLVGFITTACGADSQQIPPANERQMAALQIAWRAIEPHLSAGTYLYDTLAVQTRAGASLVRDRPTLAAWSTAAEVTGRSAGREIAWEATAGETAIDCVPPREVCRIVGGDYRVAVWLIRPADSTAELELHASFAHPHESPTGRKGIVGQVHEIKLHWDESLVSWKILSHAIHFRP